MIIIIHIFFFSNLLNFYLLVFFQQIHFVTSLADIYGIYLFGR